MRAHTAEKEPQVRVLLLGNLRFRSRFAADPPGFTSMPEEEVGKSKPDKPKHSSSSPSDISIKNFAVTDIG